MDFISTSNQVWYWNNYFSQNYNNLEQDISLYIIPKFLLIFRLHCYKSFMKQHWMHSKMLRMKDYGLKLIVRYKNLQYTISSIIMKVVIVIFAWCGINFDKVLMIFFWKIWSQEWWRKRIIFVYLHWKQNLKHCWYPECIKNVKNVTYMTVFVIFITHTFSSGYRSNYLSIFFFFKFKLGKLYFDREDFNRLSRIIKELRKSCQVKNFISTLTITKVINLDFLWYLNFKPILNIYYHPKLGHFFLWVLLLKLKL